MIKRHGIFQKRKSERAFAKNIEILLVFFNTT
jgi:hypothetical protein